MFNRRMQELEEKVKELNEKYYENGRWVELWKRIYHLEGDVESARIINDKLRQKVNLLSAALGYEYDYEEELTRNGTPVIILKKKQGK